MKEEGGRKNETEGRWAELDRLFATFVGGTIFGVIWALLAKVAAVSMVWFIGIEVVGVVVVSLCVYRLPKLQQIIHHLVDFLGERG